MSAFICNPIHIGTLAAYAAKNNCVINELINRDEDNEYHAAAIAECLIKENIKSVSIRYPEDKDGNRPGICGHSDEMYITESTEKAKSIVWQLIYCKPIDIIKMCHCLQYQYAEYDDYELSTAHKQLDIIIRHAIHRIDGYSRAPWEYSGGRTANTDC